nr:cysteine-rich CWC family protein [uncultured Rhodoferax sp.]
MSMPRSTTPEVCPLCGQGNQCAMDMERSTGQKQPPCWCTQASFSAELLASVPAADQGKTCICAACAARSLHPVQ